MRNRAAIINPRGDANDLVVYTTADQTSTFDPSWVLSSSPTGSRDFSGATFTDRIDWTSVATLTGSPVTIAMWIYFDAYDAHNTYLLCIHNAANTAYCMYIYCLAASGTINFGRQGTTELFRGSKDAFGTGAWKHLVITHDGVQTTASSIHFYFNGVANETGGTGQNGASEIAPAGLWSIGGRYYDDARNFDGRLAQVGIWNRVLTAGEITGLAAGNKPNAYATNLIFYFAGETSSLVASPGGTGTADGTTWTATGPSLPGVTMNVDYGDGTYAASTTTVSKTYGTGKGRHRVRLMCPDWSRVTTLNLYDDVGAGVFPDLSRLQKLTYLKFDTNSFVGRHPLVNQCTALTLIETEYVPFTGTWPTMQRCTGLVTILLHGAYGLNSGGLYGQLPSLAALTSLVSFDCSSNRLSGSLPSFATCTALSVFECGTNRFSGTLPSFNACTLLTLFSVGVNEFNGTIPTMAACTALTSVQLNACLFTGYTSEAFATQISLATLNLDNNYFTATEVNSVLADLVASLGGGRVACTVTLNNQHPAAAPTGQGATDKAALIAAGWTVTTD